MMGGESAARKYEGFMLKAEMEWVKAVAKEMAKAEGDALRLELAELRKAIFAPPTVKKSGAQTAPKEEKINA